MEILFQRGPHPDKIPVLHDDRLFRSEFFRLYVELFAAAVKEPSKSSAAQSSNNMCHMGNTILY